MAANSPSPKGSTATGDLSSAPFLQRAPSWSQGTGNDNDRETTHRDNNYHESVNISKIRRLGANAGSYARIPSPELCDSSVPPDDTVEEEHPAFQKRDDSPASSGGPRGVTAALSIWAFEIMTLLTSVAAFAAIFILLSVYHERPQPHMTHRINVNTIIAILSTIVKATLVYVVAEGRDTILWAARFNY